MFYFLGWKGPSLLVPATGFGIVALGLAAHFLSRLAARLGGHSLRIPVILGTLGWGWLTWHVASGMEGALTLVTIAFVFDRAYLWIAHSRARTRAGAALFILLALVLPLIRPAAIFLCVALMIMLFAFPAEGSKRLRWLALPPVGGFFVGRIFWGIVSGQSFPNGAAAK